MNLFPSCGWELFCEIGVRDEGTFVKSPYYDRYEEKESNNV